jgi:ribonucleotide reductase alpha subunit
MLMYGWQQGLKTGVYYLRSQPSEQAIKTAVDPNLIKQQDENIEVHVAPHNSEEPAHTTTHYSSSPPDTNDLINASGSGIETSSDFGGENDSTLDNDALQKELDGLDVVETGPVCNNEPGCLSCQ